MSLTLLRRILNPRTICAVAALGLGLGFAATTQAQPYNDNTSYAPDAPSVGGITVTPSYRQERTASGAEIVWARTSRVVDISDLDLSTGSGVHELHARVSRAAADACDELDHDYTVGLYPVGDDSTSDCVHRAVNRAMRDAPISYGD